MAAGVPGMAFAEAFCDEKGAGEGAMLLDGFDAIVGTGGIEAAVRAKERADGELIEAYEEDHAFTT